MWIDPGIVAGQTSLRSNSVTVFVVPVLQIHQGFTLSCSNKFKAFLRVQIVLNTNSELGVLSGEQHRYALLLRLVRPWKEESAAAPSVRSFHIGRLSPDP